MSNQTTHSALTSTLNSGNTSLSGGGNGYGYNIGIATPIYSNNNMSVGIGGSLTGGWSSAPSSYSVGAGFSFNCN